MATDATNDDMPGQGTSQREFSEAELELARLVYDQGRHFFAIPASMLDQVHRNGILPKKTADGSGSTQMHGSRNYYRE